MLFLYSFFWGEMITRNNKIMGIENYCSSLPSTSNYTIWIVYLICLEPIFFFRFDSLQIKEKWAYLKLSNNLFIFSPTYLFIYFFICIYIYILPTSFFKYTFQYIHYFFLRHLNIDRAYL